MATINKRKSIHNSKTFEGAKATIPNSIEQLKRTIMACMLWEKNFYEDGEEVADRITRLAQDISADKLEEIARSAKYEQKIRHAPLLLAVAMARKGKLRAGLLCDLIRRPDELAEFLSLYWKDGKCPISKQVKKGLAKAFRKFDEYQLAKWNRDREIKLRDVLFLCHAKPVDKKQEALWKRLVDGKLATPDTWEVELSGSENKKQSWNRLVKEKRLGAQAFLMNLRNMFEAGLDLSVIKDGLKNLNYSRMLPFQFISASRAVPSLEPLVEEIMLKALSDRPKLKGSTVFLMDISGSMDHCLSSRGELSRIDVGCGLGIILREVCEAVRVYSFSSNLVEVPARRGFALGEAIVNSQVHGQTFLGRALSSVQGIGDRIVVFTDEQSHDTVVVRGRTYIVNVANYNRGVGYGGDSVHISGWSEKVVDYIMEYENARER